ncbi:MAG: MBL fold metallo-hydrolase [Lachnospiraceae bacterium]|nr:MBL fold metallo-hydrolase [Lachnospiraceae bacterium]
MKEPAKLLYQGHASMRISTPEGKVIYIDPFMGDGYDEPADLILETHGHYDHTQTKLISKKNDDCGTITWKEAIKDGVHQTFDLGYVKVEAVEAGYNKNHNAKECVGFILSFSNGATLYVTGDTSTTPQMKELADRGLDYAFFCCDGVYNMDMSEAIECANLVGARYSIPYHMIPANAGGFDATVAATFDVPDRIILAPGDELELTITD